MRRSPVPVAAVLLVACASSSGSPLVVGGPSGSGGRGGGVSVLGGAAGSSEGGSGPAAGSGDGGSSAGSTTGGAAGTIGASGQSGASGASGAAGAAATSGSAGVSGSSGASGTNGGTGGSSGGGGGGSGAHSGGSAGAPAWPPATIQTGAPDRLLLLGTIVTPDTTYDGEVLVEGDTITCAQPGNACESAMGAMGATVIDTRGIIAPGLIDTHNHILFDIFDEDDWYPAKLYQNHNEWTAEPKYAAMLAAKHCLEDASQGKPAWCPPQWNGTLASLKCEMDKYGEMKGLVAGTTSIVGLPGTSSACFASLARSIDVPENGLGSDKIQTSALFPPSTSSADGVCANYASMKTDAYLIHVGEGVDAKSRAEFQTLGTVTTTDDCLYAPGTAITHGTAFTAAEFQTMAMHGMKLTWSPRSNVSLYGATADIPSALAAGVVVALAPDWSMGGSVNLLDEMRFADAWDDAHFGNILTAKDLVTMTTSNAAKVLALDTKIGSIAEGMLADIFVVPGDTSAPYDAILASTPRDVRLVIVGGTVLYGDQNLVAAGPATPGCETLDVCGVSKFACVAQSSTANKLNQTYADITKALSDALATIDAIRDPAKSPDLFSPLAPLVVCP